MGPEIIRQPRLLARRYREACALLAAVSAALISSLAVAQAVDGDTATARIQTVVQTPGSIDKTAYMNFGSIAQSSNAGTVVLTPANSATCTTTGGLIRTNNRQVFKLFQLRDIGGILAADRFNEE
jgi:hypothetical protein